MKRLDRDEKRILSAYERGELKSVVTSEASLRRYRDYARATLTKNRRVNIRMSTRWTLRISGHERPRKACRTRPSWRVCCTNSQPVAFLSDGRALRRVQDERLASALPHSATLLRTFHLSE